MFTYALRSEVQQHNVVVRAVTDHLVAQLLQLITQRLGVPQHLTVIGR